MIELLNLINRMASSKTNGTGIQPKIDHIRLFHSENEDRWTRQYLLATPDAMMNITSTLRNKQNVYYDGVE